MYNKTYLRLYIITKVQQLQDDANSLDQSDPANLGPAYELQGKLDLLKEMFEELNLKPESTEKMKIHNDI